MKIDKNSTQEELAAYARLYTQMIRWSDEDKRFIGSLPEICGNCCDGATRAEVASQLDEIALDLVTDKAKGEDCGTIPEPGILAVIAKPACAGDDAAQHVASLRARFGLNQHKFAALLRPVVKLATAPADSQDNMNSQTADDTKKGGEA